MLRKGLLINTNNEKKEFIINMEEGTNNISILLNDKITFVGQILREPDKCNAIIMNGLNSKNLNLEKNICQIPPFTETVYGEIFIICMDENSIPQDFTLEDFNDYITNYESKYKQNYYF